MLFAHKTVRGVSINHPLGKDDGIPQKVDDDRLTELVQRLRAGDESVHEEIIRGHIRLAINVASRYARFSPAKGEEIASEALYGVTYAVKKARAKLVDDNITAWIVSCCHRFAYRFLCRESMVPRITIWKRKQRGLTTEVKGVVPLPPSNHLPAKYQQTSMEVMELITMSAESDLDREIIDLRSQGYNDREIAEKLRVSNSYVARKRAEIRERFEELEKR